MADSRGISWVLLAAGIVILILGVLRGEPAEVLLKGVRICLECIGL